MAKSARSASLHEEPRRRYWKISAGPEGSQWGRFLSSDEISIGTYNASPAIDIGAISREKAEKVLKGKEHGGISLIPFTYDLSVGDIVFVFYGGHSKVVGICSVQTKYKFRKEGHWSRGDNYREVKWLWKVKDPKFSSINAKGLLSRPPHTFFKINENVAEKLFSMLPERERAKTSIAAVRPSIVRRVEKRTIQQITKRQVQAPTIDFPQYSGPVEEGKRYLKSHYVRERNQQKVKEAKQNRLTKKGNLECDVCGFDFSHHYGKIGNNYIEAHHKKPIASMKPGEKTSIRDIALICSNCHRMIHRQEPCLKIKELKDIYRQSSSNCPTKK